MYPVVSPCCKFMFYLSGWGKTHNFYLDGVCLRREGEGWVKIHRIEKKVMGYYPMTYAFEEEGQPCVVCLSIENTAYQLFKFNIADGTCSRISVGYEGYNFIIDQVLPSGIITGVAACANYKTFFYYEKGKLTLVPPQHK